MRYKDLYCEFYDLFSSESEELRKASIAQTPVFTPNPTPAPVKLRTGLSTSQRLAHLFIETVSLNSDAFEAATLVSIAEHKENISQKNNSFEAMCVIGAFLSIATIAHDYKALSKQHRFLEEKGLANPMSHTEIIEETLKKNSATLAIIALNTVAYGFSLAPDPTFVTNVVSTVLFFAIGIYSATKQAIAARHTHQMLKAVIANKPLLSDGPKTYQEFLTEILKKQPENLILIEAFLTAGRELKAADIDLEKTKLTQNEWHSLVKETLKFKRNLGIFNAIRTLISSLAYSILLIPGMLASMSLKMAQVLTPLAHATGIAGYLTAASMSIIKIAEYFTQRSIFKHFILNKTKFAASLVYTERVFSDEDLKTLEFKNNSKSAKAFADEIEKQGLHPTLQILRSLKDNDPLFSKYPKLRIKIERLKSSDSEKRIDWIKDIGLFIGSVAAVSEVEAKALKKKLKATAEVTREHIHLADSIFKMLTQNTLTGFPEPLHEHIQFLKTRLDSGAAVQLGQLDRALGALKKYADDQIPQPVFSKVHISQFKKAAKLYREFNNLSETIDALSRLRTSHPFYKEHRELIEDLKIGGTDSIVIERLRELDTLDQLAQVPQLHPAYAPKARQPEASNGSSVASSESFEEHKTPAEVKPVLEAKEPALVPTNSTRKIIKYLKTNPPADHKESIRTGLSLSNEELKKIKQILEAHRANQTPLEKAQEKLDFKFERLDTALDEMLSALKRIVFSKSPEGKHFIEHLKESIKFGYAPVIQSDLLHLYAHLHPDLKAENLSFHTDMLLFDSPIPLRTSTFTPRQP